MCGRFTLVDPDAIDLADLAARPANPTLVSRYNIAPTQSVAVVANTFPRAVTRMRWGLVPSWAADLSIGSRLVNARSETVVTKPAFRALVRTRRCVVLADGFYEWRREGRHARGVLFRMRSRRPFAFAGLWDTWRGGDGTAVESCTILTTTPNALVAPLHDRMPVILRRGHLDAWLSPLALAGDPDGAWFEPWPEDELDAVEVGDAVNRAGYDAPDCIEPRPLSRLL